MRQNVDKNGIPILSRGFIVKTKKGRNGCSRTPLNLPTSSNREERTGATLGRYRDIWPAVK